jgi:hypothetical protein
VESDGRRSRVDWFVDVMGVLLLSLTSVLSAVGVYQSGRWSGDETRLYNDAAAYRGAAIVAAGVTNELHLIDIGLFLRYVEALHAGDSAAERFYLERFRPEAKPAIEAWLKLKPATNPNAPKAPFYMPEYRLASDVREREQTARSAAAFTEAGAANARSEAFLRLTVIFSTVAFLAGMSTKFTFPLHLIVIVVGSFALVFGLARMLALPFL